MIAFFMLACTKAHDPSCCLAAVCCLQYASKRSEQIKLRREVLIRSSSGPSNRRGTIQCGRTPPRCNTCTKAPSRRQPSHRDVDPGEVSPVTARGHRGLRGSQCGGRRRRGRRSRCENINIVDIESPSLSAEQQAVCPRRNEDVRLSAETESLP